MAIIPDEILEKEFSTSFRGYDRAEVRAFLEEVASSLASIIRERNELKDQVLMYKKQVAILKQQEVEFRQALTAAHKSIEQMKGNAKKEAALILDRAKLDADRIIADAHQEAIALEDRIRKLRMLQREAVHKVKTSFESFLRIIEEEMALPPEEVDESLRITAEEVRAIQEPPAQKEEPPKEEVMEKEEKEEESEELSQPSSQIIPGALFDTEKTEESESKKENKEDSGFFFQPEKLWPDS